MRLVVKSFSPGSDITHVFSVSPDDELLVVGMLSHYDALVWSL